MRGDGGGDAGGESETNGCTNLYSQTVSMNAYEEIKVVSGLPW